MEFVFFSSTKLDRWSEECFLNMEVGNELASTRNCGDLGLATGYLMWVGFIYFFLLLEKIDSVRS